MTAGAHRRDERAEVRVEGGRLDRGAEGERGRGQRHEHAPVGVELERERAEREPGRAAHHSTPGSASWPGSGALLVERRPKRAPFGGGASTTGIGGGAS